MTNPSRKTSRLPCFPLLVVLSASCSSAQQAPAVEPSPELTPEEVVSAQLAALKNNDSEDNGIRITFRFASPGNKRATGPIERFIEMVKNPMYRPMLNYRSDFREPIEIADGVAKQLVTLIGADGQRAGYLFVLSKQTEGSWAGCWMTDSVVRVKVQPGAIKVAGNHREHFADRRGAPQKRH